MKIRKIALEELQGASNVQELLQEYADESSIDGLPAHNPSWELYRAMQASGMFHLLGAFDDDDQLVGFLTMVTAPLPHYSVMGATVESFFVAQDSRSIGAGMGLLREAENFARQCGCVAMLVSAPVKSRLARMMPHVGYRHTNEIFFRSLT